MCALLTIISADGLWSVTCQASSQPHSASLHSSFLSFHTHPHTISYPFPLFLLPLSFLSTEPTFTAFRTLVPNKLSTTDFLRRHCQKWRMKLKTWRAHAAWRTKCTVCVNYSMWTKSNIDISLEYYDKFAKIACESKRVSKNPNVFRVTEFRRQRIMCFEKPIKDFRVVCLSVCLFLFLNWHSWFSTIIYLLISCLVDFSRVTSLPFCLHCYDRHCCH